MKVLKLYKISQRWYDLFFTLYIENRWDHEVWKESFDLYATQIHQKIGIVDDNSRQCKISLANSLLHHGFLEKNTFNHSIQWLIFTPWNLFLYIIFQNKHNRLIQLRKHCLNSKKLVSHLNDSFVAPDEF